MIHAHSLLQGKGVQLKGSDAATRFVKKCDAGRDSQDQRLIFSQAVRGKARH